MSWFTKLLGYAEAEPAKVSEATGWLRNEAVHIGDTVVNVEQEIAKLATRFKTAKAEVIVKVDDLVSSARASVEQFLVLAQAKTDAAEKLAVSIAEQIKLREQHLLEALQAQNLATGLKAVIEQHAPSPAPNVVVVAQAGSPLAEAAKVLEAVGPIPTPPVA